jgi:dipeptidyl aminopeptidase/acylaminoacyl peptidase
MSHYSAWTLALIAVAPVAAAQGTPAEGRHSPSFSIEDVLSAPFPTSLRASHSTGRLAWVFNADGSRNVWMADRGPTGSYLARALTNYTGDDGIEITELAWRPDGEGVVYVRGGAANPLSLVHPSEPSRVWTISVKNGAPRLIGDGQGVTVSPKGDRVAYIASDGIVVARLDSTPSKEMAVRVRGGASELTWSPDGTRLAFSSSRGDHSLIGLYDVGAQSVRWLGPGVDRDLGPVWSPDGRQVAFIRLPGGDQRSFFEGTGETTWALWVADAATGAARELWHADGGPGSEVHDLEGESAFAWGAGNRVVFPWEKSGWVHLYSISADSDARGSKPTDLTPGAFEVFSADLTADRLSLVYSANQGELDHRHIWTVPVAGGSAVQLTTGDGVEDMPVAGDGGTVALLHGDARHPLHPAVVSTTGPMQDLATETVPARFPVAQLVVPQVVTFRSPDGVLVHGQLFLPPAESQSAGSARKHPALVFVHGGPVRQMLPTWHPMDAYTYMYGMNQYFASRGYVVLSVNYRGGTGYGLAFRKPAHFGPHGASEYQDVLSGGLYLAKRADVDARRIGIWGGSYGGYLTAMALARSSSVFAAGVDYAGIYDWSKFMERGGVATASPAADTARLSSPIASIHSWRSPVLVIQADDDHNVPFSQSVQTVNGLRHQGVPYDLIVIPDEIHDLLLFRSWLTYFHAQSDYFDRHLSAGSATQLSRGGR